MGQVPCKVIIDDQNADGAAAQFASTLLGLNLTLPSLRKDFSAAENRTADGLMSKAGRMLEGIMRFDHKIRDAYAPLAEKYGVAMEFIEEGTEIERFRFTLGIVNGAIEALAPQLDKKETKAVLKLSAATCYFAQQKIETVNSLLSTWSIETATEYAEQE